MTRAAVVPAWDPSMLPALEELEKFVVHVMDEMRLGWKSSLVRDARMATALQMAPTCRYDALEDA